MQYKAKESPINYTAIFEESNMDSDKIKQVFRVKGQDFDSEDQLFPALGAGLTYQLNDEKMIVRAEFAVGKDDNYGFYLKFGQPF